MIAWRGLSRLDGRTPIVVLLTGLESHRPNRKTGRVVQAYVLVDKAIPSEAARSGADRAICGECPRRRSDVRGSTCYVSLARGLPGMGRALIAGNYEQADGATVERMVHGRFVRVGAYGDPAAVPVDFWMWLIGRAGGWTAYTHRWRTTPELKPVAMASVDSDTERAEAKAAGWRTFRVRAVIPATDKYSSLVVTDVLLADEMVCPASVEGGKRTQCVDCRQCSGLASPGRDVAIIDHSVAARWARNIGPRKRQLRVL